jgi:hypothetical protein
MNRKIPNFYLGSNLNHDINRGLPSDAINHNLSKYYWWSWGESN